MDWTDNAAVHKQDANGKATNTVSVDASKPDSVRLSVNGTQVAALPGAHVGSTDGFVGLRVNHNLDVHVVRLHDHAEEGHRGQGAGEGAGEEGRTKAGGDRTARRRRPAGRREAARRRPISPSPWPRASRGARRRAGGLQRPSQPAARPPARAWRRCGAVVDGRLDEPQWAHAALLTGFSQFSPDGRRARPRTPPRCWCGTRRRRSTSASAPSSRTARRARRSPIATASARDDNVQILLGTFNDGRQAMVFAVNPLGVQADGTLIESNQNRSSRLRRRRAGARAGRPQPRLRVPVEGAS